MKDHSPPLFLKVVRKEDLHPKIVSALKAALKTKGKSSYTAINNIMRSTSRTARKTVLPDTIISGIPKGAHKNVNYSLRTHQFVFFF